MTRPETSGTTAICSFGVSVPDVVYALSNCPARTTNPSARSVRGGPPFVAAACSSLSPQAVIPTTRKSAANGARTEESRVIFGGKIFNEIVRGKNSAAPRRPPVKLRQKALRGKAGWLFGLAALVLIFQLTLPRSAEAVAVYNEYIFRPWQTLRNRTIGALPFSVGDVLYLLGGLALVIAIARWIFFCMRFRTHKQELASSLLNTLNVLLVVYIFFFIGWGGNYYKPKLDAFWNLQKPVVADDSALVRYDRFLVARLNALAPAYRATTFRAAEEHAEYCYRAFTDSRTKLHGLNTKASAFGYFMQYLGVQGYYNPWTGEAQVNRFLPPFMLPFVVCHEMAHQSGIAAEDDANLLAYALCTTAPDPAFSYSGYFNLWLYTHGRVRMSDSTLAKSIEQTIDPLVIAHRDTLRAIRKKYRSEVGRWSSSFYDGYLRMHNQRGGLDSYADVAQTAMAFEERRRAMKVLRIP